MSDLDLLAGLLSADEMSKLKEKQAKKSGKKSTGTGVTQKRHTPFKLIRSKWEFNYASILVIRQWCRNCSNVQEITNNHVLFSYQRKKTFRYPHEDIDVLDTHETWKPRHDVAHPENITFETKYYEDKSIAFCPCCAEGEVSASHLLECLNIPEEPDFYSPNTDGKELFKDAETGEEKFLDESLASLLNTEEP